MEKVWFKEEKDDKIISEKFVAREFKEDERKTRMNAEQALNHAWIKKAHTKIIENLHKDEAQRNYAIGALISLDRFANIE